MKPLIRPLSLFAATRPRQSGYYLIMWQPMTIPVRVWITYTPPNCWSWGWSKHDVGTDIERGIDQPHLIQFADVQNSCL